MAGRLFAQQGSLVALAIACSAGGRHARRGGLPCQRPLIDALLSRSHWAGHAEWRMRGMLPCCLCAGDGGVIKTIVKEGKEWAKPRDQDEVCVR